MTDDIFARYPAFRDKPDEMAMLCALLHTQGQNADAFRIGAAAVAAAPAAMSVRDDVSFTLAGRVAPFHLAMLIDQARNAAYARAIEKAVKPGMKVLEIGTGAGLLALIAARAGAEVTTCEVNPTIAAAAVAIAERNGLADRIRVIAKRSDALRIPEDLAAPADFVMHEIFGHLLFNEGVTAAMADARARLLTPEAKALPPRASVRCALARFVDPTVRDDLSDVEGFDLSLFRLLIRPDRRNMAKARKGVQLCSASHSALTMEYDRPAPFGPAAETIVLQSTGGRVDGVVQWIQLDFGDGDLLENHPLLDGQATSWGTPFFPFVMPLETQAGDRFDVTLRHRDTRLLIDAVRR